MSNFWAMVTIQKIFLDRQMHQDVKILQLFRRWLRPPSSGCFWWLDALLSSVCTWVQGGVRANPLSGQSQTIIELGLGCLLMAVHVVLLYWLSGAMFSLTRSQLFYWSFCNINVSLLLLSLYGSCRWLSWSIFFFFRNWVLCPRLTRATTYMDHIVTEVPEILLHPKNFIRGAGFTFSPTWQLIINIINNLLSHQWIA